jgi:hypothetical protein
MFSLKERQNRSNAKTYLSFCISHDGLVKPIAFAQPDMVGVWFQEGVGAGDLAGLSDSGHYPSQIPKPDPQGAWIHGSA